MELENAVDFLENKTILVAGSAGFLAKIFIEKILRAQPNVKKLYLLLRATDDESALHRFNTEVMAKELFKVIKEEWGPKIEDVIEERIKVIAGDITYENLGICDPSMVHQLRTQVDIVVNLAATTSFYERYDVSFNINTMGAKNVLNFAKSCPNLKLLLHVSTAYVSGEKEGLIMETPCGMEEALNGTKGLNINAEKVMIEETLKELHANWSSDETVTSVMKDLGIQRAKRYGWPNTYVYTKAMGEMLLGHLKGDTPLVIIRPTIITSTYKQPFPGWVEGIRTIDSLAIGFAKGRITSFVGDHKTVIDLIPADMVVNAMIIAMVAHGDNNNNNNNKSINAENGDQTSSIIYQTGSSSSNPVNFGVLQDYTFRYFTEHPWIDKEGNPIKVGRVTVFQTMKSFKQFMAIRYLLPLKGLQLLNWALFRYFQRYYNDLERKIKFVMKMIDLYAPYLFFKGIYDDRNTEKLREVARESGIEEEEFFFDPKVIDWEDYMLNTHMPGVVKYVFK